MATTNEPKRPTHTQRDEGTRLSARQKRQKLVGQLLRVARGDYTQSQVADLLSEVRGETVIQTSISRWENGLVDMSLEMLWDFEQALGLPKGSIAIAAGYIDTDVSVSALILSDPTIHPNFRADLHRIYKSYQDHTRQLNEAEGRTTIRG
jgi:transcriptional regulator with XRE-family HTH domain